MEHFRSVFDKNSSIRVRFEFHSCSFYFPVGECSSTRSRLFHQQLLWLEAPVAINGSWVALVTIVAGSPCGWHVSRSRLGLSPGAWRRCVEEFNLEHVRRGYGTSGLHMEHVRLGYGT